MPSLRVHIFRIRDAARRHPALVLVAACAAVSAALTAGQLAGSSLATSTASALACAAIVAAALSCFPRAVSLACGEPASSEGHRALPSWAASPFLAVACLACSAAAFLVVFSLLGGDASQPPAEVAGTQAGAPAPAAPASLPLVLLSFGAYLLVCACTGFYEEGLFRVLAQGVFERAFRSRGSAPESCPLLAALLVSALFALLHLSAPAPGASFTAPLAAQMALKCAQGFLFGLIMTGFVRRTGSLALAATLHACYDAALFLPWMLATGAFPSTYLTGAPAEAAALAAAALLLAPAAFAAARLLACGGAVQQPARPTRA
ncbi:MAG TPA: CPBP family intramembrane metalloprotease [Candidatus Aphodovivens avistercoris]|nr:CPBP family intramembrane metalloprotease [Candidatus Aphodovivens avistercoris]